MRLALVTGASGGIGEAVARRLAEDGYALALQAHTHMQRAEALAAALRQEGRVAQAFSCDVSDPEGVEQLLTAVRTALGRPCLLVHCAGVAHWGLVQDTSPVDWDRLFAVNTRSAFLLGRAVLEDMLSAHAGCILLVSSVWGLAGASCEAAYSASKAAVLGFTKALAKEVAPSGIRVNCIAPGVIDTPMLDGFSPEEKAALAEETPLGRLGTPWDVAEAAAFLAGAGADFITGQVLTVDGGFLL